MIRRRLILWLLLVGALVAAPDPVTPPVQWALLLPEQYLQTRINAEFFYMTLFRSAGDDIAAERFQGRLEMLQDLMAQLQAGKTNGSQ